MSTSAVASVPVASAAVTPAAVVTSGPMPYKKASITVLGMPVTKAELVLAAIAAGALGYAYMKHKWLFAPRGMAVPMAAVY